MQQSGNKLLKSANLKKSINRLASSSAGGSGGGARLVGVLLGSAAAGTIGVAGYASYDNDFRKSLEKSIPATKNVLNYAIGAAEPAPISLKELRPLQMNKDGKLTQFEAKSTEIVEKKTIVVAEPEKLKEKKVELKKELIGVKQVDPNTVTVQTATSGKIRKPKAENPYLGKENSLEKNEQLTEELKSKLISAEKATKTATTAKLETIRAIENHIQTIREAIEGGKDGDWDAVTVAHVKAKRLTAKDIEAEKEARNMVAELVAEANIGGQGETTQLNPLVPISKETAKKLSNELDEMVTSVKKIDAEQIFTRDYGSLVEESRKKFMLELKAVHPELDYEDGKKMKKSDLRTILAHAHLRVDQLSLKLIDLKMNEEKTPDILEKLRIEAEENAKKNLKPIIVPEIDHKKFDEELKIKIQEIQQKYDKKLEQVVKTQKQLYDIEHANDVKIAVEKQKEIYSSQIGKALAQLEGIEKALDGHVQMDIENRKSKQMWLATQNLVDTVKFGNRSKCCMEGKKSTVGGANEGFDEMCWK
ncbi:unnamed protein product [Caenorhabditis angaria]|uniref:MICOS complex subunit MIC60 n=1 Tax=Caenorhabditis angaria TaxID=860376 RepID=A0A9P1ITK5_9PELO|nr:unnamed protein product [Caenorhabditis angaria]